MIWEEIYLERLASAEEVRASIVAGGLVARQEQVAVVDAVDDFEWVPGAAVVCERRIRGGQFPLQLTIYTRGLSELGEDTLLKIVSALGIRCLSSDDSDNPYQMALLAPGRPAQIVDVDADALDDRDEYVLATA